MKVGCTKVYDNDSCPGMLVVVSLFSHFSQLSPLPFSASGGHFWFVVVVQPRSGAAAEPPLPSVGSLQTAPVCIPPRPAEYDLLDSFTGALVTRGDEATTGFQS